MMIPSTASHIDKNKIQEIIQNHIINNNLHTNPESAVLQIAKAIQQGYIVKKIMNLLFVYKQHGPTVLVSIINGDTSKNYIRALREFVQFCHTLGVTHLSMYVQDINSARRIAEAAGLQNIKFSHSNPNGVDPYLMIGEV